MFGDISYQVITVPVDYAFDHGKQDLPTVPSRCVVRGCLVVLLCGVSFGGAWMS